MRLVTFEVVAESASAVSAAADGSGRQMRLGIWLADDRVLDVTGFEASEAGSGSDAAHSMLDLINAGPAAWTRVRELERRALAGDAALAPHLLPQHAVRLCAPIPRPRKNVFCVGLNYRSHVEQNARALGQPVELPAIPLFFTKTTTAVIGPDDPIQHDARLTEKLDYEVELAIVIGRRGTWIPVEHALEYVFGYTLIDDVSARDLQWRTTQMFYGKGLDSYCPMGPAIVDQASLADASNVELELYVNAELRQRESTAHMLFSVPVIIAELSKGLTLEPGDVISTGTPDGCGYQLIPPRFLQPGDLVECRAEPFGGLRNRVAAVREPTEGAVAAPAAAPEAKERAR